MGQHQHEVGAAFSLRGAKLCRGLSYGSSSALFAPIVDSHILRRPPLKTC